MPTFIRVLTSQDLIPVDYQAESLAQAADHEPVDGVYTVTNTYHVTQVLKIDAHLDRMEDSAERAEFSLKLDRSRLRAALRTMILEAGFGDVRFRVTASKSWPDQLILSLEPYQPPASTLTEQGVRVITVPNSARSNPAAKTTDWMHERKAIADRLPSGVYDAILMDDTGNLLEGLAANFYVIRDQDLRTAGAGVLPGIAQQIVLEIAAGRLSITRIPPNIAELPQFDEAFLTSSSRGIIPIIQIDDHTLGQGQPGPKTRLLQAAYADWVATHLEEL
ncbi:MAG: aminotransferase class IV [Anaerolineae bacterium]|jgi:branched-chain amino acid aminotransferase|nr:aminotransferase class IV [Anaerolineae bacterium]